MSVVDVVTNIKFKPAKGSKVFYHVSPKVHEQYLAQRLASNWANKVDIAVTPVDTLPPHLLKLIQQRNADDVNYFKIEITEPDTNGVLHFQIREVYKHRKEPFPKSINLREEQSVKFDDSKYLLSIYKQKSTETKLSYDTKQTL